jgi:pyridoxine kinase
MTITSIPRVLSIQSEVVFGHVGNAAARFVLQRMGVDVLAVPTVLFSNHPGHGGFRGRVTQAAEISELISGLDERSFLRPLDAVASGYLGAPDQTAEVRTAVLKVKAANPNAIYLLDPVFGDEGGAYARPGVAEAMAKHLLPLCDIVTPNRFELASLTSRRIDDPLSAASAARILGRPLVLATSVPCGDGLIGTAAITQTGAWLVKTQRQDAHLSGTGDVLAALFLGHRVLGRDAPEALALASAALDAIIRISVAAGSGELLLVAGQDMLVTSAPLETFEI